MEIPHRPDSPIDSTFTIAITSKRYRFASRQVTITDSLSNIYFTARE